MEQFKDYFLRLQLSEVQSKIKHFESKARPNGYDVLAIKHHRLEEMILHMVLPPAPQSLEYHAEDEDSYM